MSLAERFRNLDLDVVERRVAGHVVALHWKRRARQEHINRSGACSGEPMCLCLNCLEHRSVWKRVGEIVEAARGHGHMVTKEQALKLVCDEATGGAAATPWAEVHR